MIGPQVKAGYKSTTTYHHPSVLRTVLEAMGTTANFPAAANTAPDMREFFVGNAWNCTLHHRSRGPGFFPHQQHGHRTKRKSGGQRNRAQSYYLYADLR